MSTLQTLTLSNLTDHAERWNELWTASTIARPSKRAEGVNLWRDTFAPEAEFTAIVIRQDERFVAALPLVKDSLGCLTTYRLPNNCMVASGDLLIDPNADANAVTRRMAEQVLSLPGSFAIFEEIDVTSERWRSLIEALDAAGRQMHVSPGFDVGLVDILHDWDAYTQSWSRNHRSAVKRTRKKLEAQGDIEVVRMREPSDDELYETLEACFAIEDSGWKGENGTSIVKTPGLREYCHQEAKLTRDRGMLDLWLLKLNDQIIAFEYCHFAKGTCFSYKISFDPAFEKYSPGRLLRYYQLERYHDDPAARQLDTLGIHCEAKAKWTTRSYKSGRCFAAIGGPTSNLLLKGSKTAKQWVERIRGDQDEPTSIQPGAKRYLELADRSTASPPAAASQSTAPAPTPIVTPSIDLPLTSHSESAG